MHLDNLTGHRKTPADCETKLNKTYPNRVNLESAQADIAILRAAISIAGHQLET
jgi:hypothetical protein